jgi:hypothetical protein
MTKRNAEHWRQLAKDMRRAASEMQDDPDIKLAMLKLAADYDQRAEGRNTRTSGRAPDEGARPSSTSVRSRAA